MVQVTKALAPSPLVATHPWSVSHHAFVRESAWKGNCERQGIYAQHSIPRNAPTRLRNKAKVSRFSLRYYQYICRIKTSMSPRLHKACIPSSSCKLLPPTADAVACDASKWTLPFLTSKEALAPSTAAWEGGRDCTLTWEEGCWPCWPSWRLRENTDGGHITRKKRKIARSEAKQDFLLSRGTRKESRALRSHEVCIAEYLDASYVSDLEMPFLSCFSGAASLSNISPSHPQAYSSKS